ncbi:hypothetical protein Acsp04_58850 [Actinomadura sp. NBRC 104425]|nr:hypothetical protein Acsp04_58850 [Actinomadura sp. NBRC 104425]
MNTRHRPAARAVTVGALIRYQARCTCGAAGPARRTRGEARRDVTEHINSLPPAPAEARCRDPQTHNTKPWETCPLCAGQLALW